MRNPGRAMARMVARQLFPRAWKNMLENTATEKVGITRHWKRKTRVPMEITSGSSRKRVTI
jgi:hypothetical protein